MDIQSRKIKGFLKLVIGVLLCILLLVTTDRVRYSFGTIEFSFLLDLVDVEETRPLENVDFKTLLEDYDKKIEDLKRIGAWKANPEFGKCEETKNTKPASPCEDTNCPAPPPARLEDNLKSVLISTKWLDLRQFRLLFHLFNARPTRKRIMFVSAGSSNHYYETQTLVKNLREKVFPNISNFTFVFYDLGLAQWQREQLQRHCQCEVRTYPQEYMPWKLQDLYCYTWKAFIIQANLPTTDVLVWMDASIRFHTDNIEPMIRQTEQKGLLTYRGEQGIGYVTSRVMFDYFGEQSCRFSNTTEIQAGFMLFHNERFIRQAVVRPWAICGMSPTCMCPDRPSDLLFCDMSYWKYNKCHRFDLSAISIIVGKLFHGYEASFFSNDIAYPKIIVERETQSNYFDELDRKS